MSEPRIAAAYIRVSTEEQTEYSPAAQLRELRDYARQHNLVLDERYVYSDEGISGRSAEKRPGFMQMISDARSKDHPFDVILVHKFDRFARSREDSVVYKSMLKKAGVEVISIKEPLAEGNYAGVMEALYEAFAEAYSINLGQEVRKGMKEKALRGEIQTIAAFGYRNEGKSIAPDEREAPYIVEIFRRFVSGASYFSIAKWLNEQGLTTHRGTRFENRTVEYIIRNPLYVGMVRWNPARRTRRDYNDPDIIIVHGSHTPLVSQELWDTAQARVAELKATWRYHSRPTYDRKHWLAGIVRCSACGTTLVVQYNYFKCNNYVRAKCTHSQHIRIDLLANAYIARLQQDLLSSAPLNPRIIRTSGPADALEDLRRKVARLDAKQARLTDAYLAEAIEIDEYKFLKASISKDISALRDEIAALEASASPADPSADLRAQIRATLDTITSETATIEEKYTAVNSITESCIFDKSTLTLSVT